VQDSIKETRFESHSTITAKDDDSPLEFVISGVGEDYMDSHNMWLYTSLEVRNADGSALAADEKVAPINNFFQGLIEQIQVTANGTIVAHTSEAYSYTAYLLNLLFTSREVKDSSLQTEMWYDDTPGKMHQMDHTATTLVNKGLQKRAKLIEGSKEFEGFTKLHIPMSHQPKLLPSGVNYHFRIILRKPPFVLMSPALKPAYKIVVKNAELLMTKVRLTDDLMIAHASRGSIPFSTCRLRVQSSDSSHLHDSRRLRVI
jgi:hypothetical protein